MGNATTSYACPVDNRPCEVVALFAAKLPGNIQETIAKVERLLPCNRCRDMERAARALLKVRLGKHERRALLLAPGYDEEEPKVVPPRRRGRAADESNRRAIRKLGSLDLLLLRWRQVPSKTRTKWERRQVGWIYHRRAVWRTPLGDALVGRLRARLKDGSPIRWAAHINPIIAAARLSAESLASDFRGDIEKHDSLSSQRMHFHAQAITIGGNRELNRRHINDCMEESKTCKAILKAIEESSGLPILTLLIRYILVFDRGEWIDCPFGKARM